MKQTITSLFVSMSFATPLDYSVITVRVVDHQPAVMKEELAVIVEIMHPLTVILDLGFY